MEIMNDLMESAAAKAKIAYEAALLEGVKTGNIGPRPEGKRERVSPKKGTYARSIIRTEVRGVPPRQWEYHATKGWRSYRVDPALGRR